MPNGTSHTTPVTVLIAFGTLILGAVGTALGISRNRAAKDDDLEKKIAEGDDKLDARLQAQELNCAKISSTVLTKLNVVEELQREHKKKLDYLVGWAKNGGGGDRQ